MNAVHLENVCQQYGSTTVLHDLNLSLATGEVLGLFGHNGAGKTTIIKLVLGLLRPSLGRVEVLGQSPDHSAVRGQLGYLPENVMFYPQLSGRETLYHFARLKGASCQQAENLLEQVGLAQAADRRVKTYSKGMRQRLGLAQALLGSPRLLLLDEPTVGLDPIATQDLYLLIDQLRRQGTSVVLCSHVLPGVESHIDRAAILARGRLQAAGTLTQLRAQADLPVRIRASGVARREHWVAHWCGQGVQASTVNAHGLEIRTPAEGKLDILRALVNNHEVGDVDIHQPGLDDLYRHFMQLDQGVGSEDIRL